MTVMIGVDEAGYGPNFGPLVIGATLWGVPGDASSSAPVDLFDLLHEAVAGRDDGERIAIADSKSLYKPGGGLRLLERGVLGALATRGEAVSSFSQLVRTLAADRDGRWSDAVWRRGLEPRIPTAARGDELALAAKRLSESCKERSVSTPVLGAQMLFPAEFNELVAHYGTKGAALSHVTLGLLGRMIDQADSGEGAIHCTLDKHGGRNRYGPLLQHHFPDSWIECEEESRAASRYHWSHGGRTVHATFRTKGEAELPTALASMTAKLLREYAMMAFNQFWAKQVPGIKPTAGYPVDAKRFKAQIEAMQQVLGIDDNEIWRIR